MTYAIKRFIRAKFCRACQSARNSHGQPIGSEARLLAGYLGIIA
ncbi:hypothetical protein Gotur_025953 [Gossypium turneri]